VGAICYNNYEEYKLITTNKKIYFSVTILILTIIYFVVLAFDSSTVFYYKIEELSQANIKSTETVRVVGTLVDDSLTESQIPHRSHSVYQVKTGKIP